MKEYADFANVSAIEEGRRLAPGGYVCKITKVDDYPNKEYIKLEYDIAEGSYKGYWEENEESYGWRDSFIRSYKDSAIKFFKQFTLAVEASNPGYAWKWDEKSLVGKLIGLILSEEEYVKRDGSIGTRLKVSRVSNIDRVRKGEYTIPQKKKTNAPEKSTTEISDDDLPFDF